MGDGISAEDIGDVDGERSKIETAGDETDNWHDNVINQGFGNCSEGSTDGDTNGQIDDIAAIDEFFELADNGLFGNGSKRIGRFGSVGSGF